MVAERQLAVDDGGQDVNGDFAAVELQPGVIRAGRQPHRRVGPGGAHVAHQHGVGLFAHAGQPQQAVGDGQPRGQLSLDVPVDDRRYRRWAGRNLKRHGGIRAGRDAAPGAQQPAVQPLLLDARPGQRGGVLERADLRGAHRRIAERPYRDHVLGRKLHHRSGFRLHLHQRLDADEMAHRVAQWRDGPGRPSVTHRHPGAGLRPRNHQ